MENQDICLQKEFIYILIEDESKRVPVGRCTVMKGRLIGRVIGKEQSSKEYHRGGVNDVHT